MKKGISILMSGLILALSTAGCISDKEYWLNRKQLENQAKHQPNYEAVHLEGPVTVQLKEGGKVIVRAPNQPLKEVQLPSGVKTQEQLVTHLLNVGAITVLGWRALRSAGDHNKTYKTEIHNTEEQP